MRLAVVAGNRSETIKQNLLSQRDNFLIETFNNVEELKMFIQQRSFIFDRVLLTSAIVKANPQGILEELYTFMRNYASSTRIVMIVQMKDKDVGFLFDSIFQSPAYTSMLIPTVTAVTLEEAATDEIGSLKKRYGNNINANVVVEQEIADPSLISIERTESSSVIGVADSKPEEPSKKKGFFGNLFKSGKKKEPEVSKPVEPQVASSEPESVVTDYSDFFSSPSETHSEQPSDTLNGEIKLNVDNNVSPYEMENEINDTDNMSLSPVVDDDIKSDFNEPSVEVVEEPSGFFDNEESVTEVKSVKPDTQEETVTTVEVPELNIPLDVSLERAYIEETTPVRVKEKEVIKEVVKQVEVVKEVPVEVIKEVHVAGKSKQLCTEILSGKYKAVFVVSGDRRSGVTSTCLQLLSFFSKKVEVLYVDFDIERHGVLGYLDVPLIMHYENSKIHGLRHCRSVDAFSNTIISYGNNFDLLTSVYESEVSEKDIETVQSVVADIASKYGVVIVDVPLKYLGLLDDLLLNSTTVLCCENTYHGLLNTCIELEKSNITSKYKRNLIKSGKMLLTHGQNNFKDIKSLKSAVSNVVEFDNFNWLDIPLRQPVSEFSVEVVEELLRR